MKLLFTCRKMFKMEIKDSKVIKKLKISKEMKLTTLTAVCQLCQPTRGSKVESLLILNAHLLLSKPDCIEFRYFSFFSVHLCDILSFYHLYMNTRADPHVKIFVHGRRTANTSSEKWFEITVLKELFKRMAST